MKNTAKVVPVEPTAEMLRSGGNTLKPELYEPFVNLRVARKVYKAMLAAAPVAEQGEPTNAAMKEPGETHHQPVAESQAPSTSEQGDRGVAPALAGGVPDSAPTLTEEQINNIDFGYADMTIEDKQQLCSMARELIAQHETVQRIVGDSLEVMDAMIRAIHGGSDCEKVVEMVRGYAERAGKLANSIVPSMPQRTAENFNDLALSVERILEFERDKIANIASAEFEQLRSLAILGHEVLGAETVAWRSEDGCIFTQNDLVKIADANFHNTNTPKTLTPLIVQPEVRK